MPKIVVLKIESVYMLEPIPSNLLIIIGTPTLMYDQSVLTTKSNECLLLQNIASP